MCLQFCQIDFIWLAHQENHITAAHDVTFEEFVEAWSCKVDMADGDHIDHGPYTLSFGITENGRELDLLWRYNYEDEKLKVVWPCTAYDSSEVS